MTEATARRGGFSLEDLPEQFVLAEAPTGPSSWHEDRVGSWVLRRHPTLPAIGLRDAAGRPAGWLVGYPIDATGRLLRDGEWLDSVPVEAPLDWLGEFGGRWIVIVADGPKPGIYLDPAGTLSAVYSPDDRLVTSTPNLVPYAPGREDNQELIDATGLPWSDAKYPLGLTPRQGVRQILPNHHLELTSFVMHRDWPVGPWSTDPDVDTALDRITELTSRNVRAMVQEMLCYLPLTAGRDSRLLLACARDVVSQLQLYTVPMPDRRADLDTRVATKIGRGLGLSHQVVPYLPPLQADLDEWMFRISYATGESRGWRVCTTYKSLDPARSRLVASLGEIARGKRWRVTDTPDTVVTPERLLGYCHVTVTDEAHDEVSRWLADVPTGNALQVLTLFYIEQVMGKWAGITPYADYAGPGFVLFPMNHREIVRRMVSLPVDMQRSGELQRAVIERQWPELLAWPFNQEYGYRRVHRALERRAQRLLRR